MFKTKLFQVRLMVNYIYLKLKTMLIFKDYLKFSMHFFYVYKKKKIEIVKCT